MYKYRYNGQEYEVEAAGLSIERGNLLFVRDKSEGLVEGLVPNGHWDAIFIDKDSEALRLVDPEAPKAESHEEPAE